MVRFIPPFLSLFPAESRVSLPEFPASMTASSSAAYFSLPSCDLMLQWYIYKEKMNKKKDYRDWREEEDDDEEEMHS